jgi:predicted metalloprotease with PDZ domain
MWTTYGKPGGAREGYVDHPYTIADAEATLAAVSGDKAFARDFFVRYIQGHEVADYGRLLSRAGLALRKRHPGRAWLGDLRLQSRDGWRLAALIPPTWPIYAAGIDEDDQLEQVDGRRIAGADDMAAIVARRKPGDTVAVTFIDRTGTVKKANVKLVEDPHTDVVPVEAGALTGAQKTFRDRWLGAK